MLPHLLHSLPKLINNISLPLPLCHQDSLIIHTQPLDLASTPCDRSTLVIRLPPCHHKQSHSTHKVTQACLLEATRPPTSATPDTNAPITHKPATNNQKLTSPKPHLNHHNTCSLHPKQEAPTHQDMQVAHPKQERQTHHSNPILPPSNHSPNAKKRKHKWPLAEPSQKTLKTLAMNKTKRGLQMVICTHCQPQTTK